jgi:hypothetical protein
MGRRRLGVAGTALAVGLTLLAAAPGTARACACGCGIFEIGGALMYPTDLGVTAFFEWDWQNQNQNWHGTSSAPTADNPDRLIRTNFFTLGAMAQFSRSWGAIVRVPYWYRNFVTTNEDSGAIEDLKSASIGDIRVEGIYSGFSEDLSTGLTFGLKLPTGQWQEPGFDRDTQIGSGSVDLLLGIYHLGAITSNHLLDWFVSAKLDWPFATQGGYNPGAELDSSLGAYLDLPLGGGFKVSPVIQVLGSYRMRDSGPAAHYVDTGYVRVLVAPGLSVSFGHLSIYGELAFPVYQNVNGNQVVAAVLAKGIVAYNF